MRHEEQKLLTAIGNQFRRDKHFFYKLPDFPMTDQTRFLPPRPYDAIMNWEGMGVAIEAKHMEGFAPFGIKELRKSQVDGLGDFSRSKGLSLVILGIRLGRGDFRLYMWDFELLKQLDRVSTDELKAMPYITRVKNSYDVTKIYQFIASSKKYLRLMN